MTTPASPPATANLATSRPAATVAQARTLLLRLGAIDDAGVTDLGRTLARLPVHPRLGRNSTPRLPRMFGNALVDEHAAGRIAHVAGASGGSIGRAGSAASYTATR